MISPKLPYLHFEATKIGKQVESALLQAYRDDEDIREFSSSVFRRAFPRIARSWAAKKGWERRRERLREKTVITACGLENWVKYTGITERYVEKEAKYFYGLVKSELNLDFTCPTSSLEEYAYEQEQIRFKDLEEVIGKVPKSGLIQENLNYRVVVLGYPSPC
ncbi:MAG: hypothetical protein ACUVTD_05420 [Nitrososphaerales archaeon]